nr:dTDP-glucose 4,6-dehydratase [Candidatus Soleaferrea massiliensis]
MNLSGKHLLVTGGAGFIGSNFILYLMREYDNLCITNLDKLTYAGNLENLRGVENDPRYRFVLGDVCDRTLLQSLFAEKQIDLVVHFAAESHVDRSIRDAGAFVQTNIGGTLSLLDAAMNAWKLDGGYRADVKFLQVSTDEVYGSLGKTGVFTERSPLDPHSPYAASKAGADMVVKAYHDTHGLPVCITRCSNNYGPYQFPEKLIPLMFTNCLRKKPLPVYGDGLQVRDWLYAEDHCRAIERVLLDGRAGEVYNIGGRNERTNLQIVKTIIETVRRLHDPSVSEALITHVADRKGHDRRYAIDASKIERELGWKPLVPFEEGMERTIRWYLEHEDWLAHIVSGAYEEYYRQMYGESAS